MHRQYVKWHSPRLGREMEMLVFGHAGPALLVFPTSMGRYFEYEDRGMISANWHQYESGQLQAFCVDSVDGESFYNRRAHPGHRIWRHTEYDRYLSDEVIPFIRQVNHSGHLAVAGCSFGAYHAANFALKHPGQVTGLVAMSGSFDIHQFLNGFYNDHCYFNNPVDFIPNLTDNWFLERYRGMKLVLAAGEHDICLGETRRFSDILNSKGIGHTLDVWGHNAYHDWPWWQQMAAKYFG